jgi:hypothetical protein
MLYNTKWDEKMFLGSKGLEGYDCGLFQGSGLNFHHHENLKSCVFQGIFTAFCVETEENHKNFSSTVNNLAWPRFELNTSEMQV